MTEQGDASASPSSIIASKPQHGLNLACRECQRKKIKCSRTYPCEQCSRSGLPCHPSTRKPRAKAGAKAVDAELRNRIAKLERLVESFADEDGRLPNSESSRNGSIAEDAAMSMPMPTAEKPSPRSPVDPASPRTSKYVAGTFWSSLTSEVKALADAFEEDGYGSDEDGTSPETTPSSGPYALDSSSSATTHYELIFCPPGALYVMPGATFDPSPAVAADLTTTFFDHVEPMYKLFHVPTLKAFIEHGQPYLKRAPDAACNKALRAAIYFAGASGMTEEECQVKYAKSHEQVVNEYRRIVDVALYQADPLNTTELATLQALTLYVMSARVKDSSRRCWTMVGLLVRIARAMGIHREIAGESIFLAELRRRLWYTLIFLDCYASIDRGSEPAIHPDTYTRLLPSHVNDIDFDQNTTTLTPRQGEITDMSLAVIATEASAMTISMGVSEESPYGKTWQTRLEEAYAFQKKVHENYIRYCDSSIPNHRLLSGAATAACHSMILRAVRPMQHHSVNAPPRVDSPWVMQLALNILRHSDFLWSNLDGQWRRMPWVPWHALAVTLAGLCSIREGEVADEAWDLVNKAVSRYVPLVADTKDGMLWKPLEKLRQRALAFRNGEVVRSAQKQQVPIPATPAELTWNVGTQPNVTASVLPMDVTTIQPMAPVGLDSTIDFPPDMQNALPNDNSWLDWETILQDMDDIRADDMQWT